MSKIQFLDFGKLTKKLMYDVEKKLWDIISYG